MLGEGNGNPLQCSCLENPRDGGVWWVAISEVAQSWTQLKRLSSSSRTMLTIRLEALPLCFSRNVSILFAFKLKGVKGYHSLSFKICNMKINTLFSFLVLFIHASVYSLPVSPEFQFTCAFRIKFCLCWSLCFWFWVLFFNNFLDIFMHLFSILLVASVFKKYQHWLITLCLDILVYYSLHLDVLFVFVYLHWVYFVFFF